MSKTLGDLTLQRQSTQEIHLDLEEQEEIQNSRLTERNSDASGESILKEKDVQDEIENKIPLITQKNAKLKVPPAGREPWEPQYIGMASKFTEIQEDDDKRMKAVRRALEDYHDNRIDEDVRVPLTKIRALIAACKDYAFMRFSCFRWGKAKQKLNEVAALRKEAEGIESRLAEESEKEFHWMQRAIRRDELKAQEEREKEAASEKKRKKEEERGEKNGIRYIHNKSEGANLAHLDHVQDRSNWFQKGVAGLGAALGFLLYDTLRLAVTPIAAPFIAIHNARKRAKAKSEPGYIYRPTHYGWIWSPANFYMDILDSISWNHATTDEGKDIRLPHSSHKVKEYEEALARAETPGGITKADRKILEKYLPADQIAELLAEV